MRIGPVSSFTRRPHRASSPLKLRGLKTGLTKAAGCGSCNARTSLVRPCEGCQEDLPLALPEHRNRAALSGPSRKWQIQSRPSSLRGLPGCMTALQFLLSSTPAHPSLELRHHHTILQALYILCAPSCDTTPSQRRPLPSHPLECSSTSAFEGLRGVGLLRMSALAQTCHRAASTSLQTSRLHYPSTMLYTDGKPLAYQ